jgi:murein DD-endopeptidase MepM/ murein hydrolase activator NlpD
MIERQFAFSRVAVRLMMAAGAAALMAGCSDASRFSDPFTNPFSGSTAKVDPGVDRTPTASIAAPSSSAPTPLPGRVESKPLPAATAPVVQSAPVAAAAAAAGGAAASHWTANGGTPVTVGAGDTAASMATRFGVPTDALLRANGYTSAAQVQPGSRLIIPVYRAGAVAASAAPAAAPVGPAPAKVAAAPAPAAPAKAAAAPAKPDPKVVAAEKAKAEQAAKAEALAKEQEAKRARKAEADKAAAEKAAEAKKLADAKQAEARKAAETKAAEAKAALDKARTAKADAAKKVDAQAKAEAAKAAKEARLAQAEAARAVKEAKSAEQAANAAAVSAEKVQPKVVAAAEKPAETTAAGRPVDKTATNTIPPAAAAQEEATKVSTGGDPDRPEFRWPAKGRIIQGFSTGGNDGINIAVPEGTPVKAAEGGTVAYAGSELKGYGNLVLIRHPNGYVTAYAHNGELEVKRGESVKRGQTIAKSGQSGNVGSPQLHFELRKGATPVDPTSYLAGL